MLASQATLKTYAAIGLMEEWDLSMELFDANVRSSVQRWNTSHHANMGHQSDKRNELLRWAHESPGIQRAIAGDMLLYEMARSVFKRQTRESLGKSWDY